MRRAVLAVSAALLLVSCGGSDGRAQSESAETPKASLASKADAPAAGQPAPEETDPPNVPSQKPAFPGQTRAPALTTDTAFRVETVAQGLEFPWGLAFLPDGRMLVTERPGRLRIVTPAGALSAPVQGVPKVVTGGQLGLFGLALDPAFPTNHRIYFAYSEPHEAGSNLAVARAELVEGAQPALRDLKVIFRAVPPRDGTANIGGRLVFGADGTLFVTVGDRFESKEQAQSLASDLGKIVRIDTDGAVPEDNPFVGRAGARPEIWSLGHRNGEAIAFNPWTHQLWEIEHGARGGDEINVIQPGRNYGWPVITYGEDYSGKPIGAGITQKPGMEQPLYYWDPVIAPSGMAFYTADLFPAWKGSLFVGGLASQHVARLTLKDDRVIGEEWLLSDLEERFRDVVQGPDGALYILTDNPLGRVLKLLPK
jgi:glucose/arabinose dehydrogenase